MEIGWWKRDAEGRKYQVHLNLFGGKLIWTCQRGRFEKWQPYEAPDDDDWTKALGEAEDRYVRRLITKKALELVRRKGAEG
jgi:hypothetical protein